MAFRDEIYAAKERQRLRQAALPIEEKVARLVKLQQIAREIALAVGRKPPMVWKLPSES